MKIPTTSGNVIDVSSTNANSNQDSVARVYFNGLKIAEQYINTRNPVGYLAERVGGQHLADFRCQINHAMSETAMTLSDVQSIERETGINLGYGGVE